MNATDCVSEGEVFQAQNTVGWDGDTGGKRRTARRICCCEREVVEQRKTGCDYYCLGTLRSRFGIWVAREMGGWGVVLLKARGKVATETLGNAELRIPCTGNGKLHCIWQ
jgi:hypothetical protein